MYEDFEKGRISYDDSGRRHDGGYIWFAFLIFIIFSIFAFAFLKDNKHRGGGDIAETVAGIAAIKAANGCNDGCGNYMWDHARDDLKEFGELKKENALLGKEVVIQTLGQSREMDAKFAALQTSMEARFFELFKTMSESEKDRLRDEIAALRYCNQKPAWAY